MGAIRRDSESESSKIEAATAITAIPTMPHPTHLIYLPPTGAERYAQSEEVVQIIIELSAQLWHAQVSQQPQLHIRYTVHLGYINLVLILISTIVLLLQYSVFYWFLN